VQPPLQQTPPTAPAAEQLCSSGWPLQLGEMHARPLSKLCVQTVLAGQPASAQVLLQVPSRQVAPVGHSMPQPPQFVASSKALHCP
jgi:hypothetical protein